MYHKWKPYDDNMRHYRQTLLSFFWNFGKMKKRPGDIIILQLCITNDNHMMIVSRDMEHSRQNFLSFWAIFCPFTPLTTRKIKILIKWKRHLEISSFHTSVPKITIISYAVTEIWHVTDVIFIFHFGLILPFYLPRLLILPSYLPNNPKIKL